MENTLQKIVLYLISKNKKIHKRFIDDLVQNPNLPFDFIQFVIDKTGWAKLKDYAGGFQLSYNLNINWKIVCENPNYNWDYYELSKLPGITIQNILDNLHLKWSFYYVSKRLDVTWEIVKAHFNLPWNYYILSSNPNIKWQHVCENKNLPWDYYKLTENPNITLDIIMANYPSLNWNYEGLSNKDHISLTDKKYIMYKGSYYVDKKNMIKIILENQQINWNYKHLSYNKFITIEDILANSHLPWSWIYITYNPNLQWKHIRDNPDKPWHYPEISKLSIITWEIITANNKLNWDYDLFLTNPNLTFEILYEHYGFNKIENIDFSDDSGKNKSSRMIKDIFLNTYKFNKNVYEMSIILNIEKSHFIIQPILTIIKLYV